ncbi:hypothetical protein NQZ68_007801, partial [Dissostichus eleginoides]
NILKIEAETLAAPGLNMGIQRLVRVIAALGRTSRIIKAVPFYQPSVIVLNMIRAAHSSMPTTVPIQQSQSVLVRLEGRTWHSGKKSNEA